MIKIFEEFVDGVWVSPIPKFNVGDVVTISLTSRQTMGGINFNDLYKNQFFEVSSVNRYKTEVRYNVTPIGKKTTVIANLEEDEIIKAESYELDAMKYNL
jgi:hypothetical protein